MAYQDGFQQPLVQCNWTCASCGATITELKFNPRPGSKVFCKDCYRQNRPDRGERRAPKAKVQGNWTCKDCGVAITELPFTPKDDSNVKCYNCYKQSKA